MIRIKKFVPVLLSLFIALSAYGQDLEYAKRVVKDLSSPAFGGRGYVDNGLDKAAKYIKKQYAEIGVKPFGNDYYQPFRLDVNTFPSTLKLAIDGTELIPGEEYLVHPTSPSLKGTYAVSVIRKDELLNENTVKACVESLAGKVLIVDETDFTIEDKEEIKKINEKMIFLRTDPTVPSAATIIYSATRPIWSVGRRQGPKPVFMVKKDLDLKNIRKVDINIKAKFVDHETRNVIGYIEGKSKPDSFLVVTAHYDHLGKMGKKAIFPGANDNATGVAMMLNFAKYFAANPSEYSVVFMALSAEEAGIVGAKYCAEHPMLALDKIKFLINFDMAGTGDEGITVVNGTVFQKEFNLLEKLNEDGGYLSAVKVRGESCNSDHCPFYQKGVPSFFIYTNGGSQPYHDIRDVYDTLPFSGFEGYTKLMIDFFNNVR